MQWALAILPAAAHLLRQAPAAPAAPATGCPGTPECMGHGDCVKETNVCMCEPGFGGTDCASEVPLFLEVTNIGPEELQDAKGVYRLDAMFLSVTDHPAGAAGVQQGMLPSQIKFIHYDHASKGWAVSKFNSSCIDDICFFAYNQDPRPPTYGYVYGGRELEARVRLPLRLHPGPERALLRA